MNRTVIVDACRTPIGKFGGGLSSETSVDLGRHCLRDLLNRVEKKIPAEMAVKAEGDLLKRKPYFNTVYPQKKNSKEIKLPLPISPTAAMVEEAIIGNVLSAGQGQNPARQIIIPSLSRRVPATTVNQVCASGMKSVMLADSLINSGVNKVMIAGGVESMSRAPHILHSRGEQAKAAGRSLGSWEVEDVIMRDGLKDAFHDYPMGVTAENLAEGWKIGREEQDEFAYYSQQKATAAEKNNRFNTERSVYQSDKIHPKTKEPLASLANDEFIRGDVSLEKLSTLKPVFTADTPTVTAGNASGVNDGASLLYLMNEEDAMAWGVSPLATIVTSVNVAIDETVMGYTPKVVIEELLRRSELKWENIASVEVNEAFAVQTLAVLKDLGIPSDEYNRVDNDNPTKINPWGGAIALGHPIGCSGARVITTLAHTLQGMKSIHPKQTIYGIAALCVGGGQGCGLLLKV